MHISDVSGHKEASANIERAIRMLDPEAIVLSINIFDYTGPTISNIITKLYVKTIKNAPAIWGFLYDNKQIISGTKKIKEFIYSRGYRKIEGLINAFKPDVVIATQAFPCGVCAEYKRHFGDVFKLIGVMTDHAPHAYWFEEGVDYYIVSSDEVRNKLIENNISQDKVKALGIPIDPKFRNIFINEKIFDKLKIQRDIPVVLIMGGGQGIGPIKKIIKKLDKTKSGFQIILVCGTNKKLELQIKKKNKSYKKNIVVLGFTKNIDELMSISSLIITKAGGLTTSEAISKGVPMVIIRPIPGQEVCNTNYLVKKQVAVYVKNITKLTAVVDGLLKDRNKLKEMKKNTALISKPDSSLDISSFALSLC